MAARGVARPPGAFRPDRSVHGSPAPGRRPGRRLPPRLIRPPITWARKTAQPALPPRTDRSTDHLRPEDGPAGAFRPGSIGPRINCARKAARSRLAGRLFGGVERNRQRSRCRSPRGTSDVATFVDGEQSPLAARLARSPARIRSAPATTAAVRADWASATGASNPNSFDGTEHCTPRGAPPPRRGDFPRDSFRTTEQGSEDPCDRGGPSRRARPGSQVARHRPRGTRRGGQRGTSLTKNGSRGYHSRSR